MARNLADDRRESEARARAREVIRPRRALAYTEPVDARNHRIATASAIASPRRVMVIRYPVSVTGSFLGRSRSMVWGARHPQFTPTSMTAGRCPPSRSPCSAAASTAASRSPVPLRGRRCAGRCRSPGAPSHAQDALSRRTRWFQVRVLAPLPIPRVLNDIGRWLSPRRPRSPAKRRCRRRGSREKRASTSGARAYRRRAFRRLRVRPRREPRPALPAR